MIVGFGTYAQEGALRTAGAENVFRHPRDLNFLIERVSLLLRAGDVLLMVQPGLLKASEFRLIRDASPDGLLFQVVGHPPFPLTRTMHFKEFRKIKPRGVKTEMVQTTGRPAQIKYNMAQADAIIRLWHDVPRRKPSEVTELAKKVLQLPEDFDLKQSWVRDLVIKFVGTARRDKPDDWSGLKSKKTGKSDADKES